MKAIGIVAVRDFIFDFRASDGLAAQRAALAGAIATIRAGRSFGRKLAMLHQRSSSRPEFVFALHQWHDGFLACPLRATSSLTSPRTEVNDGRPGDSAL